MKCESLLKANVCCGILNNTEFVGENKKYLHRFIHIRRIIKFR